MSRPFIDFLQAYIHDSKVHLDRFLKDQSIEAHDIDIRSGDIVDHFEKLSAGGKRLRGALMQLGYMVMGGKEKESILKASISAEVLHTALLIHDDVMDRDILRRNVVTMHELYRQNYLAKNLHAAHIGVSTAITGGDIGIFLSFVALSQSSFKPVYVIKALELLGRYGTLTGYGQALDLFHAYEVEGTIEMTLKIHKYKTAMYTGVMPLHIGATLAGVLDGKRLEILKQYGEAFGWAFQIQDDILGTFGDAKLIGKSNLSDLCEGKRTALLLSFLETATKSQKELASRVVGNPQASDSDIHELLELMRKTGSLQRTIDLGWSYVEKGKSFVPHLTEDKDIQDIMNDALSFMMERVQ